MPELTELQQQANTLRATGNYRQACQLYQKIWTDTTCEPGDWDGWGYAFCLLKQRRFRESIAICHQVSKRFPDFDGIRGVYAWSIYHLELKNCDGRNEPQAMQAAEAITQITTQEDSFGPYCHTVLLMLHRLSQKRPYPAEKIIEWTDKLNVDLLSTEPFQFTSLTGKQREHSSKREKYYVYRSKALNTLRRYEENLVICQRALDEIERFHDGNRLWILRQQAVAFRNLGHYLEALGCYDEILMDKKDWYVLKDMADIHDLWDQSSESLKYAISAVMAPGDSDKKTMVYDLLTNVLRKMGNTKMADKHMALGYYIRLRNHWTIHPEIQKKMQVLRTSMPMERQLYNELRQYWEVTLYGPHPRHKGKIINILPNGKSGFLIDDDASTYFFAFQNVQARRSDIQAGRGVSFNLETGYDKKKKEKVIVAVNVNLL